AVRCRLEVLGESGPTDGQALLEPWVQRLSEDLEVRHARSGEVVRLAHVVADLRIRGVGRPSALEAIAIEDGAVLHADGLAPGVLGVLIVLGRASAPELAQDGVELREQIVRVRLPLGRIRGGTLDGGVQAGMLAAQLAAVVGSGWRGEKMDEKRGAYGRADV